MTLNHTLILKKLELIDQYEKQLADFLKSADADILSSPEKYLATERAFQLLVDAMLDVNQHIIREQNLAIPDDLQSTFYPLGKTGILPQSFAETLAPIVGVRNRLVHQYEKIDKTLFLKNLRKNFSQFDKYQKHIQKFLTSSASSS